MRTRAYMQVDVFSEQALFGNPLAVVLDSQDLSDAQMQAFARWTNLSETTFLYPPTAAAQAQGADYRVRIFTPGGELPFAGHPTLGSCHAWLASGGKPQKEAYVVQECAKGLVPLKLTPHGGGSGTASWAFAAPALIRDPISEAELAPVLQAAGVAREQVLAAQKLNNGPVFWALLLDTPERIFNLTPDTAALHALGVELAVAALHDKAPALIGRASREARAFSGAESNTADQADNPDIEVRVWFRTGTTLTEDPITGSLNASLAQWLIAEQHIQAPYVASQGVNLDRFGLVRISQDATGQVWVGGHVTTLIEGAVQL